MIDVERKKCCNTSPPPFSKWYEDEILSVSADLCLESQKRQWLTSMSYSNDSSINPIAILYEFCLSRTTLSTVSSRFRDEHKRRETEEKQALDELKREVFNLPDTVDYGERCLSNVEASSQTRFV